MKPGDKVRTMLGEEGIIAHAAVDSLYHWWVKIPIKGSSHVCDEPYREEELTLIEPTPASSPQASTSQHQSVQVVDSS